MPPPLRSAQIYAAEDRPTIVAPMHFNSAGIRYEQDEALIAESGDWETVVHHLRRALETFSFREANLRDQRVRDWASYRASRMRSVRKFQREYLCIQTVAFDESELLYDACCQPHDEHDITLHVTLNPRAADGEIMKLLNKLFHSCLRWPIAISA